jgi:acetyl-CoA C-acetyltransferase
MDPRAPVIVAYTIAYDRDGSTEAVIMSALTPAGERMLLRSSDRELMLAASGSDLVGEPVKFAGGERVYVPSARQSRTESEAARA